MSFCTEDEDTVNTTLSETLAQMREEYKQGLHVPKVRNINFNIGDAYWPTHPSASNHPIDDYKWDDRYDHPKD